MAMKDNVRRLRRSRDMTQEQLANVLGVERATVAQWESGMSYPRMSTAIELVKYFGISLDDLMADRIVDASDALTADEMELLAIYRSLDDTGRETALRLLTALSPRAGDTCSVSEGKLA